MKTLEERFWAKVNKKGPIPPHMPHLGRCWEWTASTNAQGYGKFNSGGSFLAPRVAWSLYYGAEPKLNVLHHCDNPKCVRKSHLFEGTNFANLDDLSKKLKNKKLPRHLANRWRHMKLSRRDVKEIRAAFPYCPQKSRGEIRIALAKRFNVTPGMISSVVSGKHWSKA